MGLPAGHVLGGEHGTHARQGARCRDVEASQDRMRHAGAQDARVEHAWEGVVVGEAGRAGHLGNAIRPGEDVAHHAGLAGRG